MRLIDTIIVHCSATYPDMDIGADEIRRWHVEDNGWSDIGYHFVIRRDGTVETGRDVAVAGAHAKGHNRHSIGVCVVGGKARGGRQACNFTVAQWRALAALVERLQDAHGPLKVIGHNDVSSKDCPTFDVAAWREVA